MRGNLPNLYKLLGYFNEDWTLDYADSLAVVRAYTSEVALEEVRNTLQELDQLLNMKLDEKTLNSVVIDELGSCYLPQSEGKSMAEWLQWLRSELARSLGKTSSRG